MNSAAPPLSLYRRPASLIFLDDDANYLEMLALVMPRAWSVRLFTRADDCIAHIRQKHADWEADLWAHHAIIDAWRAGSALIPQILHYWQTHTTRYALAKVYVVDYAMPAMTGLDVLQALPYWPSERVLLTGKADELVAVTAFNQGLINRFVPKQRPDIGAYLTQILGGLRNSAMPLYEGVWRTTLRKDHYEALNSIAVALWIEQFVAQHQWVEYVVLGQPFGILGLDSEARPHWLQLELVHELSAAADLALSSGLANEKAHDIHLGLQLANTELLMALQQDLPSATAKTFSLGPSSGILGALFELPDIVQTGPSYKQFLAKLPLRDTDQAA